MTEMLYGGLLFTKEQMKKLLLLLLLLPPYIYTGTHFSKDEKPEIKKMKVLNNDGRIVTIYMNSIYSLHFKNVNCHECHIVPNIVYEVSDRPFIYCSLHIQELFPDLLQRLTLK